MSGAVFADAGSLFGAGAGAKKRSNDAVRRCRCTSIPTPGVLNPAICLADSAAIRASVGVSILWNSPLGPLRLDIAKALLQGDPTTRSS